MINKLNSNNNRMYYKEWSLSIEEFHFWGYATSRCPAILPTTLMICLTATSTALRSFNGVENGGSIHIWIQPRGTEISI